jgi:hypothetical protein
MRDQSNPEEGSQPKRATGLTYSCTTTRPLSSGIEYFCDKSWTNVLSVEYIAGVNAPGSLESAPNSSVSIPIE